MRLSLGWWEPRAYRYQRELHTVAAAQGLGAAPADFGPERSPLGGVAHGACSPIDESELVAQ